MRAALFLGFVSLAACTDQLDPTGSDQPAPDSVRERLADLTRLRVAVDASSGSITADRKSGAEWASSTVPLPYLNGAIELSADSRDAVTIESLQVSFDEIPLPEGLFGGRASSLTGVRIDLEDATRADATWANENDVTLHVELPLALHWEITIDGSATALGSPRLPKLPLDIHLTGDGAHVDASFAGALEGEFWSWAGVFKLSDLDLAIAAELTPAL